jgi:hypothetical protein
MSASPWTLAIRYLILSGMILVLALTVSAVWPISTLADMSTGKLFIWLNFLLGIVWCIAFAIVYGWGIQTFGGVGFDGKVYVLVAILAILDCLVGFRAFGSYWRLMGVIPLILGAYILLPWITAMTSRIVRH